MFTLDLEQKLLKMFGQEEFKGGKDRLVDLFSPFKVLFKSRGLQIITVAGTNGKGETCFHLGELLRLNNKKVAIFTSPHIFSVTERFIFDGQAISEKFLEKLIDSTAIQGMSYFEYLFYLFCQVVKKKEEINYLVLEVGLGGRLDATNLFDTDMALISSISRDHQEFLGSRYDQILIEKLGITRDFKPLISNFSLSYLREKVQDEILKRGILYSDLFELGVCGQDDNFSIQNRSLAKFAISKLGLESSFNYDASSKGRFEEVTSGRNRFIFVGAHNLDGIRKVIDFLGQDNSFDKVLVSFSKRNDLDLFQMVRAIKLSPFQKCVEFCYFSHSKALTEERLDELCRASGFGKPKWLDNFVRNLALAEDKKYLVFGSYYFIGEFQKTLLADSPNQPSL